MQFKNYRLCQPLKRMEAHVLVPTHIASAPRASHGGLSALLSPQGRVPPVRRGERGAAYTIGDPGYSSPVERLETPVVRPARTEANGLMMAVLPVR